MTNFRNRFTKALLEQAAQTPVASATAAADPTQLPEVEQGQITNNAALKASLDSTSAAGDIGNVAIKKMPEWKQQIGQLQQMTTKILDEIQPTAGQPGAADIWKSLKNSLVKITKETGSMLGQLEGLSRTIPVSQKAAAIQK